MKPAFFLFLMVAVVYSKKANKEQTITSENEYTEPIIHTIKTLSPGEDVVQTNAVISSTPFPGPPDPDCNATKVSDLSNNSLTLTINTSQDGVQRYQARIPNITINSTWDKSLLLITGLSAGTPYNIHLQSVGVNNVTSKLSCNITAVTRPNKPNCSRVKVTQRSTSSISLILPTTDSIKGHRVHSSNQLNIDSTENGSDTLITLTELQPGGAYNITIQAVGNGNITSLESCSYRAFTCPPDPDCNATKVSDLSTNSLTLTINTLQDGVQRYQARIPNHPIHSKWDGSHLLITALSAGTSYNIQLQSVGVNNVTSKFSCNITAVTRPPDPDCNATKVSDLSTNSLTLTINTLQDGVQRYQARIPNHPIHSKWDGSHLLITDLSAGTSYNIQLQSVGVNNVTSKFLCNITAVTRPPDPDCNATKVSDLSTNSLTLTINTPQDGVQRYQARIPNHPVHSKWDGSHLLITDLSPGTSYNIQLQSVGVNNVTSKFLCKITAVTRPPDPDCNATKVSDLSTNSLTLTINTPQDGVQRYQARIPNHPIHSKWDGSHLLITDLSAGTSYNIQLQSVGVNNVTSKFSCNITAVTRPPDPDCNATKVSDLSTNSLTLTINTPQDGVQRYQARIPNHPIHSKWDGSHLLITDLSAGKSYNIHLQSVGVNNVTSKFSCNITAVTRPPVPDCNAAKVSDLSTNSLTLTINTPQDGVQRYQARISNHPIHSKWDGSHLLITDLSAGTSYNIHLQSVGVNNVTSKPLCNITAVTRPNKPNCSKVKVTKRTTNSISLILPTTDSIKGHRIHASYEINIDSKENGSDTLITLTKLQPGGAYNITIQAVGNGNITSLESCDYTAFTYPAKPGQLSSLDKNTTWIVVNWNAPKEHVDSYNVSISCQCRQDNQTCKPVVENSDKITAPTANISHLVPGTHCKLSISAVSNGLESESREIEDIESKEEKPGKVSNITVDISSITTSSVMLSWFPPSQPNGDITNYTVSISTLSNTRVSTNTSKALFLSVQQLTPGYVVQYQYRNHSSNYCDDDSTQNLELVFNKTIDTKQDDDAQTVTFDNLFPYWSYSFKVAAKTSVGYGNWSYSIENRTLSAAPDRVRNIKVADITANSVSVSWIQPCFQNGQIDQYLITVLSTSDAKNDTVPGTQLQYQAAGLLPFKVYKISISGHTKDTKWGEMAHYTGNITTSTDVPHASTNVIGHTISSTSLNVTWAPGEPQTGQTSYVVSAYDTKTGGNVSSCIAEGFSKTWCVIENLDQYWNYTLIVVASTVNGSTNSTKSPLVTTAQDAPGKIQSLQVSVEEDATRPRQVNVSWKSPKERDLNGKIQHYYVEYYANGENMETKELLATQFSLDNVNVVAGKNYTFTVYASTIKKGTEVIKTSVVIPMGAPPLIKKLLIQTGPTGLISNDEKQLSVYLQKKYLCDSTNGIPVKWGIIVSEDSETGQTAEPFRGNQTEYLAEQKKRYKTWSQVHESDKMEPYIASNAFDPECPSRRRKRDASESRVNFVVGSDGNCDSSTGICNGYLKPGKTYRVRSWSCTLGGCVESEYSTPLSTEPNMVPLIAGVSTSFTVVFIAVAVVTLLYLRRTQKGPFRKKAESDSGHSNEGFDGTGESVEMHRKGKAPRPVKLTDFESHVGRMHCDSDLLFREEYELLKNTCQRHPATVAEGQGARTKNRYTNILAYDHSRVKLLPSDDEEGSDYINANYIPGFNGQREFIATQGPQASTIDDFWRMIWEQSVTTIVMLTQLVERGRKKCDQYWPGKPFEPVFYGDIVVELTSESTLPNYMLREFALKLGDVTRKVKHFQYLDWPDMGTPETSDSMIGFVRNVRSHVPVTNKGPIVVHCSAGVGRTGTFIAVDHLIHHVKQHATIDIYELVMNLRNNRNNMVQTEDQYVFIHDCMNDFINNDDDESDEGQEPVYENA